MKDLKVYNTTNDYNNSEKRYPKVSYTKDEKDIYFFRHNATYKVFDDVTTEVKLASQPQVFESYKVYGDNIITNSEDGYLAAYKSDGKLNTVQEKVKTKDEYIINDNLQFVLVNQNVPPQKVEFRLADGSPFNIKDVNGIMEYYSMNGKDIFDALYYKRGSVEWNENIDETHINDGYLALKILNTKTNEKEGKIELPIEQIYVSYVLLIGDNKIDTKFTIDSETRTNNVSDIKFFNEGDLLNNNINISLNKKELDINNVDSIFLVLPPTINNEIMHVVKGSAEWNENIDETHINDGYLLLKNPNIQTFASGSSFNMSCILTIDGVMQDTDMTCNDMTQTNIINNISLQKYLIPIDINIDYSQKLVSYKLIFDKTLEKDSKFIDSDGVAYLYEEISSNIINGNEIIVVNQGTTDSMQSALGALINIDKNGTVSIPIAEITTMNKIPFKNGEIIKLDFLLQKDTECNDGVFFYCNNLTNINFDRNEGRTLFGNTSQMFYDCQNLIEVDLSSLDTSKMKDMSSFFYNCIKLLNVKFSKDFGKSCTNMRSMFGGCANLQFINVDNFNTSQVTDMGYMFVDCVNLIEINLNNWDTSSVTDISYMFGWDYKIEHIYMDTWTTPNLLKLEHAFHKCFHLKEIDMNNMNVSQVKSFESLFYGCNLITKINISNWSTDMAETFSSMFLFCFNLESLSLLNFKTSKVTTMLQMFKGCSVKHLDLSSFTFEKCTSINAMFWNIYVEYIDLSNADLNENINTNAIFRTIPENGTIKIPSTSQEAWMKIINYYDVMKTWNIEVVDKSIA